MARLTRTELVVGVCKQCASHEWPKKPIENHKCAQNDEDRLYGTVRYSLPYYNSAGEFLHRYSVNTWPQCEICGKRYCSICGEQEWYQDL